MAPITMRSNPGPIAKMFGVEARKKFDRCPIGALLKLPNAYQPSFWGRLDDIKLFGNPMPDEIVNLLESARSGNELALKKLKAAELYYAAFQLGEKMNWDRIPDKDHGDFELLTDGITPDLAQAVLTGMGEAELSVGKIICTVYRPMVAGLSPRQIYKIIKFLKKQGFGVNLPSLLQMDRVKEVLSKLIVMGGREELGMEKGTDPLRLRIDTMSQGSIIGYDFTRDMKEDKAVAVLISYQDRTGFVMEEQLVDLDAAMPEVTFRLVRQPI